MLKFAATGLLIASVLAIQSCDRPPTSQSDTDTARSPPNFLIILADDLGINDISLNGSTLVSTPNIDSLAHDGARFVQAYAADAVCAPSRAGLLTGRYPPRFGFEANPLPASAAQPVLDAQAAGRPVPHSGTDPDAVHIDAPTKAMPLSEQGIPDSEETFVRGLQAAGYTTGAFGKWHLGYHPALGPAARGFEESIVFPGGAMLYADPTSPDVVNGPFTWSAFDTSLWKRLKWDLVRDGKPTPVSKYMTYTIADDASAFIKRNKDEPFALYVAFNAPHNPVQAPRDLYDQMDHIEEHHLRVYFAAVKALDIAVGQLLQTLNEAGVADNTVVVFASDNGGAVYVHNPTSNLPFRGWKSTYFEGGVRVPLLVRWPDRIKPQTIIRDPASLLDLAPTIRELGGAGPGPNPTDGVDLSALLRGETSSVPDRTLFFRNDQYRMVIDGGFKLQTSQFPVRSWLYNLKTDPAERNNLASVEPEKAAELKAMLEAHDRELAPPRWPVLVRKIIDVDGDINPAPADAEQIYWALSSSE